MTTEKSNWKHSLRRGIALLLFLCLLAGLLPQGVWAQNGEEELKDATRAATDYVSIAAGLAKPLVLNRRVDTNLVFADIYKLSGPYIVVHRDAVASSYWAINPHKVSGNTMQMTKVNVQTLASESFSDGTIANYPKYIKGLDKTVAENLAMTFSYAGDVSGPANGYLTNVGWDEGAASFAFRIFRSDEAEMQFSNGGPGIETSGGAVTMGLKFDTKKTDRPTVRLYRNMRNAASSSLGAYSFQGNAYNSSPTKNYVLKFHAPSGSTSAYVELFKSANTNGSGDRASFFLYEYFGKEATFLYTVITEAASYLQKVESVDPNSANTKALITAFNNAVSTYKKYNVLPMPNDADPRGDMTKAAETLVSFYSFIDIPVEILDFRSDLFMMEFDNEYFSLVHDYTTKPEYFAIPGGNLTLPGDVVYRSGVPFYRTGIMENKLHNGYPMYRREVIDFVAKLLYYKTNEADMYNYSTTKRLDRLTGHGVDWNKTFYNLFRNHNVALGDLESVVDTTVGGKYGDTLFWDNMDKNSCYALAYYMLTNLWRPVTGEGTYAYNTKVPERTSLRLFTDINGLYSIDANQNISYNGHMGNIMPRVNRGLTTWQVPCFAPIDNLGFEKNGKETDLSPDALDGFKKTNYNFTMHAYGSFVYYKDQDLYFEFSGDDDVYFYVNNTMALDLGGAHTAAKGTVILNEKAETLGLVDGEVYTFDMFYAERRTEGSNLKFATNIKIVDTDTLTTKGQYLDTESGVSMVDPTTGKGPELIDYAPINVGDTVAYSFDLQNTRDVPVQKLSFTDSTLGVTVSHGSVLLNSLTKITDLRLYYTTISGGRLNTSAPVVKTLAQMRELLQKANKLSGSTYGSLPAGCYRVNITSVAMLKELLTLGVPINCKLSVYGFKRVVAKEDTPYINTVYSDCFTLDEKLITGTASRVITAFVAPKGRDTSLVLDYGKSIQITADVLKKSITVASGSSVSVGNCVGLTTDNGYSGQLLKTRPTIVTKYSGTQGDFSFGSSAITYTPNKFLEGTDCVFAVYNISNCTVTGAGGKTVTYPYILLRLRTIPATSVYYEAETFKSELSYTEKRTNSANAVTYYTQWGQAGAANATKSEGSADNLQGYLPVGADHPYGYDPSYDNDTLLSNGKSLYVEGAGVIPGKESDIPNYTRIKFSFVGTGFEIISRTNTSQGSIRVSVYADEAMTEANRERALTVNNYGELNLYQIPVVSIKDLSYGRHYVSVEVNDKVNLPTIGLYFGNQFYFDALRIYDPIDVSGSSLKGDQGLAYEAYTADREARPVITKFRDFLLDVANTEGITGLIKGAMFVDTKEFTNEGNSTGGSTLIQVNNHTAVTAATYEKAGPKNEVYLSPGQAVAFKLEFTNGQIPLRIDVGAKTIRGDEAILGAGFVTSATTDIGKLDKATAIAKTVKTSTDMYYSLNTKNLSAKQNTYLVIYNGYNAGSYDPTNPGHVLSVTDLKVVYASTTAIDTTEVRPYSFAVDGQTLKAAAVFIKEFPQTAILDSGAKIMHSLNLTGDISVNYVVSKADLEGCEGITMEVAIPVYEGEQQTDSEYVTLYPVEKDAYYYFTLTGITAVQMNDEMEAVLHWNKDGQDHYSDTDVYSVSRYAYTQMNKTGSEKLKVLCANLLRYGAQAQLLKGYRLNALADSDMTEEQRGYCTDLDTVTFGNTNVIGKDLESPTVEWVGKSMNLGSKVALKFVFAIGEYNGDLGDLNLRVSYTDIDGKLVTATVREIEAYNAPAGQYAFSFDGLLAAELRTVVSAQIYAGDEAVSCTLKYSADTYGRNKTGTLGAVCKALFAYSDSAKAYFQ